MQSIHDILDFDSKKNLLWQILKITLRHKKQAVGDTSEKIEIYEDQEGFEYSKNFIKRFNLDTLAGILEMKYYYDNRNSINDFKNKLKSFLTPNSTFKLEQHDEK